MLKIQDIRQIIKQVDQTTIHKFTYEHDDYKITIEKSEVATPTDSTQGALSVVQTDTSTNVEQSVQVNQERESQEERESIQENDETIIEVTSPMVGTFYQKPSPESKPYVVIGSKVKEDSIICIVEAMKLFNEIEAEVVGEIVEILVEDGSLVEYGQPLFKVKTK